MKISREVLLGQTHDHVTPFEGTVQLHPEAAEAFRRLRKRADQDGIGLNIASHFRDFSAQLRIWAEKCQGKREVLDKNGHSLSLSTLTPKELVFAILRWSALPGASRHHWGTDLDIYDRHALPQGAKLRLVPEEIGPGAPFYRLNQWLENELSSEGFFRPYSRDRGGVSPEWWHISYQPVAQMYFDAYQVEFLEDALKKNALPLLEVVLADLPYIYQNYVRNICFPESQ